jgi:hypothetical protein
MPSVVAVHHISLDPASQVGDQKGDISHDFAGFLVLAMEGSDFVHVMDEPLKMGLEVKLEELRAVFDVPAGVVGNEPESIPSDVFVLLN